jgi:hypothetical protein
MDSIMLQNSRELFLKAMQVMSEKGTINSVLFVFNAEGIVTESVLTPPTSSGNIELMISSISDCTGYFLVTLGIDRKEYDGIPVEGVDIVVQDLALDLASIPADEAVLRTPDSFLMGVMDSPTESRLILAGFYEESSSFGDVIESAYVGGTLSGLGPCHSWN